MMMLVVVVLWFKAFKHCIVIDVHMDLRFAVVLTISCHMYNDYMYISINCLCILVLACVFVNFDCMLCHRRLVLM